MFAEVLYGPGQKVPMDRTTSAKAPKLKGHERTLLAVVPEVSQPHFASEMPAELVFEQLLIEFLFDSFLFDFFVLL